MKGNLSWLGVHTLGLSRDLQSRPAGLEIVIGIEIVVSAPVIVRPFGVEDVLIYIVINIVIVDDCDVIVLKASAAVASPSAAAAVIVGSGCS